MDTPTPTTTGPASASAGSGGNNVDTAGGSQQQQQPQQQLMFTGCDTVDDDEQNQSTATQQEQQQQHGGGTTNMEQQQQQQQELQMGDEQQQQQIQQVQQQTTNSSGNNSAVAVVMADTLADSLVDNFPDDLKELSGFSPLGPTTLSPAQLSAAAATTTTTSGATAAVMVPNAAAAAVSGVNVTTVTAPAHLLMEPKMELDPSASTAGPFFTFPHHPQQQQHQLNVPATQPSCITAPASTNGHSYHFNQFPFTSGPGSAPPAGPCSVDSGHSSSDFQLQQQQLQQQLQQNQQQQQMAPQPNRLVIRDPFAPDLLPGQQQHGIEQQQNGNNNNNGMLPPMLNWQGRPPDDCKTMAETARAITDPGKPPMVTVPNIRDNPSRMMIPQWAFMTNPIQQQRLEQLYPQGTFPPGHFNRWSPMPMPILRPMPPPGSRFVLVEVRPGFQLQPSMFPPNLIGKLPPNVVPGILMPSPNNPGLPGLLMLVNGQLLPQNAVNRVLFPVIPPPPGAMMGQPMQPSQAQPQQPNAGQAAGPAGQQQQQQQPNAGNQPQVQQQQQSMPMPTTSAGGGTAAGAAGTGNAPKEKKKKETSKQRKQREAKQEAERKEQEQKQAAAAEAVTMALPPPIGMDGPHQHQQQQGGFFAGGRGGGGGPPGPTVAGQMMQQQHQDSAGGGGNNNNNNVCFKVPGRSPPLKRSGGPMQQQQPGNRAGAGGQQQQHGQQQQPGGPAQQPMMMMLQPMPDERIHAVGQCCQCRAEINPQRKAIQCTAINQGCHQLFHWDCSGLTQEAFAEFCKDSRLEWICDVCFNIRSKQECFMYAY